MNTSFGSTFAHVDDSANPEQLRQYLDDVRRVSSVLAEKRRSFALLELRPGSAVLDVGCGAGDDVLELAGMVGSTGRAVGVDGSRLLVNEGRRRSAGTRERVQFLCADATELPLPEASFDAVRADRTIQHVFAADVALAEMARVLRPSGVLVITEMVNHLRFAEDGSAPLTRTVLGKLWTERERGGWISIFLPPLLDRAGFGPPEIHRHRVQITDFASAATLLNLAELSCEAVRTHEASAEDAGRWLTELSQSFGSGQAHLQAEFIHMRARPLTRD